VAAKLEQDWSPEQIAGWLKLEFPHDKTMWVSHETIYLTLFIQARGALKRELRGHLRRSRSIRRPRTAGRAHHGQGQIIAAVPIRDRPAEAADRAIPGHWEGDLLAGAANSHIATLVERHSRFLMLVAVDGKDSRSVISALSREVRKLPQQLRASLTWDRGMEMAQHARFTIATDVKVYFCDPQSPWQRGSNENTNGLLRQYLPKGTDLSKLTQLELDTIATRINTRTRRTLHFQTPAATLNAACADALRAPVLCCCCAPTPVISLPKKERASSPPPWRPERSEI
jgi:IS30 family transposase